MFFYYFRVFVTDNQPVLTTHIFDEDMDDSENNEHPMTVEVTDVLENNNLESSLSFSLPPHQRCAAHTLNLIATVDVIEAEKDLAYKVISRRVFAKCHAIFNKQNQSTLSADKIKEHLGRYLITPNATR